MPTRRFVIDVDRDLLRANLSREEQRDVPEAEVRQWLLDAGFRPHGDRWLVNEPDLGQLDPSEVRSVADAGLEGA
jgi:hypothetical protein